MIKIRIHAIFYPTDWFVVLYCTYVYYNSVLVHVHTDNIFPCLMFPALYSDIAANQMSLLPKVIDIHNVSIMIHGQVHFGFLSRNWFHYPIF